MSLVAYLPLILALVGLLLWILSSNPKVAEIGKILFAAGALTSMLTFANHVVRFGG